MLFKSRMDSAVNVYSCGLLSLVRCERAWALLTHWHSSQMRKAPSVASSWLSWMSTLMTCTGWKVSCSREFRSERDARGYSGARDADVTQQMCSDVSSPSSTWSYTRSSQVMTRSNWSLQLWKRSGRVLMRLLRSNMCKMPFCVYLRRISGQGRQQTDRASHSHIKLTAMFTKG